jgi:hypothetical protein
MILARRSFLPLLWGEAGGEGERGSRHFHGLRMRIWLQARSNTFTLRGNLRCA